MEQALNGTHLPMGEQISTKYDRVGIIASVACAVHCLAAPILLLFLPAVSGIWSHPAVHWVLAALVLPIALIVVYRGYSRHKRLAAMFAAVGGSLFTVAGLCIPEAHAFQFGAAEATEACTKSCCPSVTLDEQAKLAGFTLPYTSAATFIGGLLLITGHAINIHGTRCLSNAISGKGCSNAECGCPAGEVS